MNIKETLISQFISFAVGMSAIILVFLVCLLILSPLKSNKSEESINQIAIKVNETKLLKQPLFLEIAQNFSQKHDYNFTKYDCRFYTIDLYQEYLRNGIEAEPVIGYNLTNPDAHAFLKITVYLEPQTGKVVDYSDQYEVIDDYDEVMKLYRDGLFEGIDVK